MSLIETEETLDEVLTHPSIALIEFIKTLSSPLVILGAGGKMGPSLSVLAQRATEVAGHSLEVIAVSRFSDKNTRLWLERRGVRTISCDLLDRSSLDHLPDAKNIIYLVGFKFGTTNNPARTWAINTLIPAHAAERYPRTRMVALSSGNVYPLSAVHKGGSVETDPLTPLGEYANACVARERIFEFYAQQNQTPLINIRLNYAVELRYGVLLDIASKVWAGEAVDVTMGHLNCIWQGDANEMILRALALAAVPTQVLNLTGPDTLQVHRLAQQFGELLGKSPQITGVEAETALLSNSVKACSLLGSPPTSLETILRWVAHWVQIGGRQLGKPTHFEIRSGSY
jgi:dTDP-4-dehydrorhamnose reductase